MDGKMTHTIAVLKTLTKNSRCNEEQLNAIFDAIEMLREYDAEIDLKRCLVESIGKNYIFNAKTEYGEGWNAATRGILDLLDPDKERYKRGASA